MSDCDCVSSKRTQPRNTRKVLTDRKRRRLLVDANAIIAPYIHLDEYESPAVLGLCPHLDGIILEVRWVKRGDPDTVVVLSSVWWDESSGAILQSGCNYGNLTL